MDDSHRDEPPVPAPVSGSPSPLWWSAPQRLAGAMLLAAALWLVIGWAVA